MIWGLKVAENDLPSPSMNSMTIPSTITLRIDVNISRQALLFEQICQLSWKTIIKYLLVRNDVRDWAFIGHYKILLDKVYCFDVSVIKLDGMGALTKALVTAGIRIEGGREDYNGLSTPMNILH